MTERSSKPIKAPSLHHLPPQSLEAEDAILSAILIDNSTLMDVLEVLAPEDFYFRYQILAEDRTTTIFATHHRGEALAMGTRVAVILDGRIAHADAGDGGGREDDTGGVISGTRGERQ